MRPVDPMTVTSSPSASVVVAVSVPTTTLADGELVTVNGSTGRIYRGRIKTEHAAKSFEQVHWSDIWSGWLELTRDRPELVPIISTAEALRAMPSEVTKIVLMPDLDLRTNK